MSVATGRGRPAGIAGKVFHSRICATVTASSCLAHLWIVAGNQHGTWLNLLMLAMVAVCLPCAVHIWRGRDCDPRRAGAVRRVMASALVMAGVHAVLLLGAGGSGHAHHGATSGAAAAAGAAPSGSGALLAVIALEMTTALLAATLTARLRPQPRLAG
ncbi:hypothetical protein [Arthrobacter sp. NicSoilB8]|uniref:hypothetical protein n=1 Tax=Arthrobacter sp. NicSoilB8 TaxID=2830998 RepID=UPI001CC741E4|nr:hypothetical protein [Arthrobacter sp. NicSoilB8]BCW73111.1 hypothetical protein NicSoilB8_41550 [Arthrobacter sp. NicSoilB8]